MKGYSDLIFASLSACLIKYTTNLFLWFPLSVNLGITDISCGSVRYIEYGVWRKGNISNRLKDYADRQWKERKTKKRKPFEILPNAKEKLMKKNWNKKSEKEEGIPSRFVCCVSLAHNNQQAFCVCLKEITPFMDNFRIFRYLRFSNFRISVLPILFFEPIFCFIKYL